MQILSIFKELTKTWKKSLKRSQGTSSWLGLQHCLGLRTMEASTAKVDLALESKDLEVAAEA